MYERQYGRVVMFVFFFQIIFDLSVFKDKHSLLKEHVLLSLNYLYMSLKLCNELCVYVCKSSSQNFLVPSRYRTTVFY